MADFLAFPHFFVFVALLFQSLGFLARDELWLRALIFIGTIFYLLYYYFVGSQVAAGEVAGGDGGRPLWAVLLASGVLGVINLGMIILLIFERTTFAMSEEMTKIYESFPTLNPGQFRKVLRAGVFKEGPPGRVLVRDGSPLHKLILVTKGQVEIAKGEKKYCSSANVFIGEVSFLRKGNASATVTIRKPAQYVEWRHAELRRLMRKSHAMNNALIALFGAELAGKVENAMPVDLAD